MPAARSRRREKPHQVLHLKTYERLEEYLRAFAAGHFHLVILVGAGGLAKSRTVRAVLNGQACWIEGNATPFGMYVKLYRHRDQFVVIDDVDALYADRSGVRLLKCLCQTEEEKSVAWHSDARSLERQGIPREFTTKSRVIIIANDWKTLDKNVAALQDRGHVLLFQPGAAEVHEKAGTWFDDREIYEWFGANLDRVREPSLRHYVRARELKTAGMDWTTVLAEEPENARARLVAELLGSAAYASTAARVQAFIERKGGCRATFFNHLRKLRSVEERPATRPKRKAAEGRGSEAEILPGTESAGVVMSTKRRIFTIGYGGKTREEFLEPLKRHGVEVVADVRMDPTRASMGMFVKAKSPDQGIEKTLGEAGIGYQWFEELGNPEPKDPEMKAFRARMAGEAKERTWRLIELASQKTVCLLCREKAHEGCHRSMIGDYLASQDWEVVSL